MRTDPSDLDSFRARARAWLAVNAPAHEVDPAEQGHLLTLEQFQRWQAWHHAKSGAGWAGLHWPEHAGGRGLSRQHAVVYELEEQAYTVPRGEYLNVGHQFAAPTILAYGSEETQRRLLPRILDGSEYWCQLFSEPAAGSDLAGIRTRAVRDDEEGGDYWVVNGQKVWTTYAQWAKWAILVTRTDPEVPKHKGLTYFWVDMTSPGIEIRPIRKIDGEVHFNEVFLTDVRVPDAQRLGAVAEGWLVALTTLSNERLGSGKSTVRSLFDPLFALARTVATETGPAVDDPAVREALASWYVECRGLDVVAQRNIERTARGLQPGPETSITKVVSAGLRQDVANFALDLLDQAQLDDRSRPFVQSFFDAPGNRLAGGTDEVMRNIIAERILRLPGDIRVDRDLAFQEIPVDR